MLSIGFGLTDLAHLPRRALFTDLDPMSRVMSDRPSFQDAVYQVTHGQVAAQTVLLQYNVQCKLRIAMSDNADNIEDTVVLVDCPEVMPPITLSWTPGQQYRLWTYRCRHLHHQHTRWVMHWILIVLIVTVGCGVMVAIPFAVRKKHHRQMLRP
jgi:hypothetical protein